MPDRKQSVMVASDALRRLAMRAPKQGEQQQLNEVADRLRAHIGRIDPADAGELPGRLADQIKRIDNAVRHDDFSLALQTGRRLADSLPGYDDPNPKKPWQV